MDTATGVAYFTTDTTPATGGALWQMQAVELRTGQEVTNFPVAIHGTATNAPDKTFDPVLEMQRPGLASSRALCTRPSAPTVTFRRGTAGSSA